MRLMNATAPIPAVKPYSPPSGVVSAAELMRGQPVLNIEHGGERYQLRLTKNGKLILTK